jgi:hypothetical protein
MKIRFLRFLFTAGLTASACLHLAATSAAGQQAALRWFKGNLHTHTANSDGDSPPAEVVAWYKNNAYDFLVITDHEHLTPVDELNARFAEAGKFLVVQGQEVTDRLNDKPYHVNALGSTRVVMPQRGTDVV